MVSHNRDSEDDILLSLFSKDNVEGGKPECSPSGGTIMPSGLWMVDYGAAI